MALHQIIALSACAHKHFHDNFIRSRRSDRKAPSNVVRARFSAHSSSHVVSSVYQQVDMHLQNFILGSQIAQCLPSEKQHTQGCPKYTNDLSHPTDDLSSIIMNNSIRTESRKFTGTVVKCTSAKSTVFHLSHPLPFPDSFQGILDGIDDEDTLMATIKELYSVVEILTLLLGSDLAANVLSSSFYKHLTFEEVKGIYPFLHFLVKDLGMDKEDVAKVLRRRNTFFSPFAVDIHCVKKEVMPYLMFEIGLSPMEISKMVCMYPEVLSSHCYHTFGLVYDYFVDELGLSPSTLGKILKTCPDLLVARPESVVLHTKKKVEWLVHDAKLFSSEGQVCRLISKCPALVTTSLEGMTEVIEYITSTMGLSQPEIAAFLTACPEILVTEVWLATEQKLLDIAEAADFTFEELTQVAKTNPTYLSQYFKKANRLPPAF